MSKKRIFSLSFWVLVLLLFCTAVSFRIQELMRNEVVTTNAVEIENGEKYVLPASCIGEGRYGDMGLYRIIRQKGIWGDEIAVAFNIVPILEYGEDEAVIMADGAGLPVDIIMESVYPVEEKMIVEVVPEILTQEEAITFAKEQQDNLIILGLSVLAAMILAFIAERCLQHIFEKNIWKCILGFAFIFIAAGLLWYSMNRLDIPRPALPEECIFDWKFYKEMF